MPAGLSRNLLTSNIVLGFNHGPINHGLATPRIIFYPASVSRHSKYLEIPHGKYRAIPFGKYRAIPSIGICIDRLKSVVSVNFRI